MLRRKLTLIALFAAVAVLGACSDITSPSQDGDGEERCQVTAGSETRCAPLPE